MRWAPWLLLLNACFLVGVVRGMTPDSVVVPGLADAPGEGAVQVQEAGTASLEDYLPLPGMSGWEETRDACTDMEAFLQAASRVLEKGGHLPPIRPGQQILSPHGNCGVQDTGVSQLLAVYAGAFEQAGLVFPGVVQ